MRYLQYEFFATSAHSISGKARDVAGAAIDSLNCFDGPGHILFTVPAAVDVQVFFLREWSFDRWRGILDSKLVPNMLSGSAVEISEVP